MKGGRREGAGILALSEDKKKLATRLKMKVSNLYYIVPNIQAFCANQMMEGDFILSVRWFDLNLGETIDEQIFDARGKEKSFKTANAIFSFLRQVYPNGHAKLEINFG